MKGLRSDPPELGMPLRVRMSVSIQRARRPPGARQQRHVQLDRFAGPFAVEQRAGNAAGNEHAADGIAKGRNALGQRAGQFLGRHRMGDAAA